MRAVHQAFGADAAEHPIEQRNLWDVALAVERHALWIQTAGKPACGDLQAAFFDAFGVLTLDERMQIGHEEKAFHIFSLRRPYAGADGAAVVAEVKSSRRIDAS